jgi:hypothetical protein
MSYLINIASHINTIEKANILIDKLKHFKQKNIDVCVTLHSSMFLDEIAKHTKFLIYDEDNSGVFSKDFYENADVVHNNLYTISMYDNLPSVRVETKVSEGYHSKSAMKLFKNGIDMAIQNNYDWYIYMEYDIISPIYGYTELIESQIQHLENVNKECFYYQTEKFGFNHLYGGLILLKANSLKTSTTFTSNWGHSKRDWIKTFGTTFFEVAIELCIHESIPANNIETMMINTAAKSQWGYDTADDLNQCTAFIPSKAISLFNLNIIPYKSDTTEYGLILYGKSELPALTIKNIEIFADDTLILSIPEKQMLTNTWFYEHLHINPYKCGEIKLCYNVIESDIIIPNTIRFESKNIEKIYNHIMNIVFN